MIDHNAGWVLAVAHRRNHAAAHDLSAGMKAAERENVAELCPPPLCEGTRQTCFVVGERQPGAALDNAVLLLTPVAAKLNRRGGGGHGGTIRQAIHLFEQIAAETSGLS